MATRLTLVALSLSLPMAAPVCAQRVHPAAIVAESYQRAVDARDGDEASRWVSTNTLEYFERRREDALTLRSTGLRRRPPLARMTTFSLRAHHTAADLGALTARQVFAREGDRGHVLGGGGYVIGVVRGGGDAVHVLLRHRGGGDAGYVKLRRESDGWRVDVAEMIERANEQLRELEGGLDVDVMLSTIEGELGRPLEPEVWTPLASRR